MTTQEILIDLIDRSELSTIRKHQTKALVQFAYEERDQNQTDRKFVEETASEKHVSDIVFKSDSIIIYTVYGNDDWSVKYPFRSIYLDKKQQWRRCGTVSHSLESAFLIAIGERQLGSNSQFHGFAAKMLELETPE